MKIAMLVGCCLAFSGCTGQVEPLPSAKEISRMTTSLYHRPDSGPDIEEFTIAAQDYGKVLSLFTGRKLDRSPAKWQVLGHVKIESGSSSELVIDLFWTGGGPGAFRIGRTYYRGTTDREIISVLSDCYAAVQGQKSVTV